jgi:hypothetical protein
MQSFFGKEAITMGFINDLYILAETETVDWDYTTTTHPTETGMPLASTVQKKPTVVSLTGKIVDVDNRTARGIIGRIKNWQKMGWLNTYTGQCGQFRNMQIQDFSADFTHKNNGGADFTMTLQEVRIVESAYVKPLASTIKPVKVDAAVVPAIGDRVTFAGGNVYVASDSKKPASVRPKSTCKITKISNYTWTLHKYHLESTDNAGVCGWVDASKVSPFKIALRNSSRAGTQSTKNLG